MWPRSSGAVTSLTRSRSSTTPVNRLHRLPTPARSRRWCWPRRGGGGVVARWVPNRVNIRKTAQAKGIELVIPTAQRVRDIAKRIAPRKTGKLGRSIRMKRRVTASYVQATVGSHLSYAAAQHDGAERHYIRARRVRLLKFFWERVGRWFSGPIVDHPGNAPHEYLYRPLRQVALRRGFIVVKVVRASDAVFPTSSSAFL